MKKFIVAIFAMFAILYISTPVKAETEKRSFYDYVRSYGYSGQRKVCTYYAYGGGYQMEYWVWSDDVPVVTFKVGDAYCFFSVPNCTYSNPEAGQNPVLYQVTGNQLNSFSFGGTAYAALNSLDDIFYLEQDKPVYYLGANIDWTANATDNAVDVTWSGAENFLEQMEEEGWQNPNDPNKIGGLPMLNFSMTRSTALVFPNVFDYKEVLTWDYRTVPQYATSPNQYSLEIIASSRVSSQSNLGVHFQDTSDMTLDSSHQVVLSNGGTSVASNEFSFLTNKTGESVYQTYGYHWNAHNENTGYNVYVRIKDNAGNVSAWKIFRINGFGVVTPYGYAQDGSDMKPLPENQNDSWSPDGGYTTNGDTTAENDPTSQEYDGTSQYNPGTVIENLKSSVNTLQELPSLFSQVVTFIPDWLVSLMFISIGLVVIVGVVKLIIR